MPVTGVKKITQREEFNAVMSAGVLATTPHFALHASKNHSTTRFRIGAVVPKRWAKRAVTRNSIKRQIYSMAQQCEQPFEQMDIVIRLRKAFAANDYISASSVKLKTDVRLELALLLKKSAT
jgi:ribonuclease P protein component